MLDELFRCDKFQHLFPGASMPVRACLRRQLERIPTKDAKGRLEPLEEWPAPKPYCAAECPVGRAHLARARAEHVPAETCLRCGAAQVGEGSANPCQGCPPDEKQVPRGSLRSTGAPKSERIWTSEVPDVPIGAPGHQQTVSLNEMRRQAAERQRAVAAQEQTMAKDQVGEKHCTKCGKKLRRDNTRGVCGHRCKAPGDAPTGRVKPVAAKVTTLRPATPRRAKAADRSLEEAPLAELLKKRSEAAGLIAAVDAELQRRKLEIDAALAAPRRAAAEG